jgi:polar amino acid transport system substrate-binding protein
MTLPLSLACRRSLLLQLLLGWGLWIGGHASAGAGPLRIVTEELPPYSMMVDDKVGGLSTEVVQALLAELGMQASIEIMPWARAYDLALNEKNVLIYSMTRSPEREALFHWVGTVAPVHWYLFSSTVRPLALTRLDDAMAYQIGTVKADAGEDYLLAHGFSLKHNLQSSNKYELNYEKLKFAHIDLWINDQYSANYLARQAGDDPAQTLVRSLPLASLGDELSLAFSLGTPQATVERFRRGLETIHRNGTYDAIARKWL